jgi:Zn-dependent protease
LPLDGGRVLFSLLPHQLAWQFSRIEPFGLFIVLGLLATGLLGTLIRPFMFLGEWIVRLVL